jgi:uncharacterized protein YndB with AHSA1/START domain
MLVAILLLGVTFIVGAYVLPGSIAVERSIEIATTPDKVFAIVGDLKRGREYSPWAEVDPNAQYEFSGAEIGVGQKMNWRSTHPEVGTGSMTVTEYEPDRRMAAALDLGDMGQATTYFGLAPEGSGTKVTWGFSAALQNPLERWMCALFDFDALIGKDYEKGLTKLKALVEKPLP